MKKGRKDIEETTHVLMTKFDILKKLECSVYQTEIFGFYSYEMINIYK
jgi:hypothetical protein